MNYPTTSGTELIPSYVITVKYLKNQGGIIEILQNVPSTKNLKKQLNFSNKWLKLSMVFKKSKAPFSYQIFFLTQSGEKNDSCKRNRIPKTYNIRNDITTSVFDDDYS